MKHVANGWIVSLEDLLERSGLVEILHGRVVRFSV